MQQISAWTGLRRAISSVPPTVEIVTFYHDESSSPTQARRYATTAAMSASALAAVAAHICSSKGLSAATACGAAVAVAGLNVVSGYARGVDMATHVAALQAGGRTLVVLAEGITKFRVKRGEFGDAYDPSRVTVVSQFSPTSPWSTGSEDDAQTPSSSEAAAE